MAEDSFKEDKTESATAKKRTDMRDKGQVMQSQEVNTVIVLIFSALILYLLGNYYLARFFYLFRTSFSLATHFRITPLNLPSIFTNFSILLATILLPFFALILIFGVGASFAQVGWIFSPSALELKWDKIKPKFDKLNFFKMDKVVDLATSLGKLCIIIPVVYFSLTAELHKILPLADAPLILCWIFIMKLVFTIVMRVSVLLIFMAAADYAWKWWKHEEEIKMTKEEVKQERKDQEGDPKIKGWQKSQRMKMMRQFMLSQVPEADVVITNPTTYAVAVKYNDMSMNAPQVIAKGMRKIAERIREIAKAHDIPIVENKALAQALYNDVEIGQEVPSSFYKAVAEILAYVFKLKDKKVHI